jgi:hypothetical protein
MNQEEIEQVLSYLKTNGFWFVGLSADWIDEVWSINPDKAITVRDVEHFSPVGTFLMFVDIDSGEDQPYFKLVERTFCLETEEYFDDQFDVFIEGDFDRLMDFLKRDREFTTEKETT